MLLLFRYLGFRRMPEWKELWFSTKLLLIVFGPLGGIPMGRGRML